MTLNLALVREEFAAKKRGAMTGIEEALRPIVTEAVDLTTDTGGWTELLHAIEEQYGLAYRDETGDTGTPPEGFLDAIHETLRLTKSPRTEATVDRIVTWLATAILSEATIQASVDDPEELFLEWVTMHDNDVRTAHREADGQQRPVGEKFRVDRFEMSRPGDTSVPIELWINCRCTLRPVLASEALVASAEAKNKSTVVVGLPAKDHAVHSVGEEQKHVTLAYLGEHDNPDPIHEAVKRIASDTPPFQAGVSGNATLGADKAKVLLVEAPEIQGLRNRLMDDPDVQSGVQAADSHPHFVPHMTLTYGDAPDTTEFDSIPIDRLAVWHRDEQTEYPLGGGMTEQDTETQPTVAADVGRVPWHGVLAPEGKPSGDGRMFAPDSLRNRDLPLPLTWQKVSDDGHKGSVTVATIETLDRVDGEMRASGFFLETPEADEVISLLAEFGRFGVSVDADDAQFEMDEETEQVVFTSARIASAAICAIPAFAEAYVSLGDWANEEPIPEGEKVAATLNATVTSDEFADLAPGKTEDGPGWLTHPVDTDRLRDYWTKGAGAAKINWGVPGDFNRCRAEVGKYVKPQYLAGYCANRHYDALGFWPGRPVSGETIKFAGDGLEFTDTGEALSMTASAGQGGGAPAAWFRDQELDGPTPLTVTDDGQVFGHVATWGTCHIGIGDSCVTPPQSVTNYAYFMTGEKALDDGSRIAVGQISMGGGHATARLGVKPAMAHYDSTSAAVCDVVAGEDEHGIWIAGGVRDGVTPEQRAELQAAALSGDWRKVGGNLELVAALAVNVPGFPIPRVQVAASSEGQVSLVAAGVVSEKPRQGGVPIDVEALAVAVAAQIEARAERKQKMAALAARVERQADGV